MPAVCRLAFQAALLSAVILAGCAGQSASQKNLAAIEIVDFRVRCLNEGAPCSSLKRFLEAELPRHKYAFTRSSSRQAPYIQVFDLGDEVPLDSLEPPHSHVRVFRPLQEEAEADGNNPIIILNLFNRSGTIADFNVEVFAREDDTLRLTATSDVHEAAPAAGDSLQASWGILKSIVRYSYK